jgi:hypothetical protein
MPATAANTETTTKPRRKMSEKTMQRLHAAAQRTAKPSVGRFLRLNRKLIHRATKKTLHTSSLLEFSFEDIRQEIELELISTYDKYDPRKSRWTWIEFQRGHVARRLVAGSLRQKWPYAASDIRGAWRTRQDGIERPRTGLMPVDCDYVRSDDGSVVSVFDREASPEAQEAFDAVETRDRVAKLLASLPACYAEPVREFLATGGEAPKERLKVQLGAIRKVALALGIWPERRPDYDAELVLPATLAAAIREEALAPVRRRTLQLGLGLDAPRNHAGEPSRPKAAASRRKGPVQEPALLSLFAPPPEEPSRAPRKRPVSSKLPQFLDMHVVGYGVEETP